MAILTITRSLNSIQVVGNIKNAERKSWRDLQKWNGRNMPDKKAHYVTKILNSPKMYFSNHPMSLVSLILN